MEDVHVVVVVQDLLLLTISHVFNWTVEKEMIVKKEEMVVSEGLKNASFVCKGKGIVVH